MKGRRSPSCGYDFAGKNRYRKVLWDLIERQIAAGKRNVARILCLPSSEGIEIDRILDRGFREENLFIVDDNPAIVAHLKRRYPRVHTYGVSLCAAAERIEREGVKVHVANLDLCGRIGMPLFHEIIGVSRSGILAGRALVAVTVLRGRETSDTVERLDKIAWLTGREVGGQLMGQCLSRELFFGCEPNERDFARVLLCGIALSSERAVAPLAWGGYRSEAGSQTMLWSLFLIRPWEEFEAENRARKIMGSSIEYDEPNENLYVLTKRFHQVLPVAIIAAGSRIPLYDLVMAERGSLTEISTVILRR